VNPLDDTSRDAYRESLLREVVAERFGGVPWREAHQKPSPRPQKLVRVKYGAKVCARRRQTLMNALTDPIDAAWAGAA
jgi:hypothetical protein